jgi:hypothetical protein
MNGRLRLKADQTANVESNTYISVVSEFVIFGLNSVQVVTLFATLIVDAKLSLSGACRAIALQVMAIHTLEPRTLVKMPKAEGSCDETRSAVEVLLAI